MMSIPDVEMLAVRLFTVVLVCLPDGTNVYSSRDAAFEGMGRCRGIGDCKIVYLWGTSYSLVQILLL